MSLVLKEALALPIGKSLAYGNWESFVYELGDRYVYKEIKPTESLEKDVDNYSMRTILQDFWNTDIHYHHMRHDIEVLNSEISDWLPESTIQQGQSLLSNRTDVTYTIQERIRGHEPEQHTEVNILAKKLLFICESVFHAPVDLHRGNLIRTDDGALYFIDTGTPSDWSYFLSPKKMQDALGLNASAAEDFVLFMTPLHEKHWEKLKELAC